VREPSVFSTVSDALSRLNPSGASNPVDTEMRRILLNERAIFFLRTLSAATLGGACRKILQKPKIRAHLQKRNKTQLQCFFTLTSALLTVDNPDPTRRLWNLSLLWGEFPLAGFVDATWLKARPKEIKHD
jgi:hypothetical protein